MFHVWLAFRYTTVWQSKTMLRQPDQKVSYFKDTSKRWMHTRIVAINHNTKAVQILDEEGNLKWIDQAQQSIVLWQGRDKRLAANSDRGRPATGGQQVSLPTSDHKTPSG